MRSNNKYAASDTKNYNMSEKKSDSEVQGIGLTKVFV